MSAPTHTYPTITPLAHEALFDARGELVQIDHLRRGREIYLSICDLGRDGVRWVVWSVLDTSPQLLIKSHASGTVAVMGSMKRARFEAQAAGREAMRAVTGAQLRAA